MHSHSAFRQLEMSFSLSRPGGSGSHNDEFLHPLFLHSPKMLNVRIEIVSRGSVDPC